ncbi:MAG: hypothetical protein K2W96_00510 [Gemmataceae bacterium]|nr:hypothetical protein [Gemmataceae bacterium]
METPPVPEAVVYRLSDDGSKEESRARGGPAGHRHPLCPRCHRPVPWNDALCSHCGYCFGRHDTGRPIRRDSLPDRAGLVKVLGTVALFAGSLGLCVGPFGLAGSLGAGIPAAWMAAHDLERMKTGEVDPGGKGDTEAGMHKAFMGMALGCVLGGVFTVWMLTYWM